jgi:hypothetical protein
MNIDPTYFLVYLLIIVVTFIIFRVFILWYWKVNRIVALLEDIKYRLGDNKGGVAGKEPAESSKVLEY